MSRLGWIGVVALLLGGSAVAQERSLEDARTAMLPQLSTFTLADERAACAEGQWDSYVAQVAQAHPQEDGAFPDAATHCPAVLRETARRGRLRDLYAFAARGQGVDGDGGVEHQRVLSAALKGQGAYDSLSGVRRPISCALAFDAGVYFGVSFPNDPVATDVTAATIDGLTQACFSGQAMSLRHATIAGIRTGQRFASEN